jgi:2-iminobutanoate/2-iminopropanoate deaminase
LTGYCFLFELVPDLRFPIAFTRAFKAESHFLAQWVRFGCKIRNRSRAHESLELHESGKGTQLLEVIYQTRYIQRVQAYNTRPAMMKKTEKTELCVLGAPKAASAQTKPLAEGGKPPKTIIQPAKSPTPVGPYNHAVRMGNLLFCSGQIPLDPRTGKLVGGDDIRAQTERALKNLQAILDQEKLTFQHVVKTTVFLVNLDDFAEMNEVYGQYFNRDYPARSTVQVSALPRGARVEIEAIAGYGSAA